MDWKGLSRQIRSLIYRHQIPQVDILYQDRVDSLRNNEPPVGTVLRELLQLFGCRIHTVGREGPGTLRTESMVGVGSEPLGYKPLSRANSLMVVVNLC